MASEDMDSLTFGAPKFLRHLMDPSSKKIPVMEFEVAKVHYGPLHSLYFGSIAVMPYLFFLGSGAVRTHHGAVC